MPWLPYKPHAPLRGYCYEPVTCLHTVEKMGLQTDDHNQRKNGSPLKEFKRGIEREELLAAAHCLYILYAQAVALSVLFKQSYQLHCLSLELLLFFSLRQTSLGKAE